MQEELPCQGGSCGQGRRLVQSTPWTAKVAVTDSPHVKDPESLLCIHFRKKASCNEWFFLQLPKRVLVSPHRQRLHLARRLRLTLFSYVDRCVMFFR